MKLPKVAGLHLLLAILAKSDSYVLFNFFDVVWKASVRFMRNFISGVPSKCDSYP